jgi:hypothetical protein
VSINDFNMDELERALSQPRRLPPVRVMWHSILCRANRHQDQLFCIGRTDRTRLIHKECHWCGRPMMATAKEIEEFDEQFPPVC